MTVATPPQLTNVVNFRDLGGATARDGRVVRTGLIYRSGHLAHLSDDDVRELERVGIRTIFDFRGPADIAADGDDRLPAGARRVELPMSERSSADIRSLFAAADSDALHRHFGDGKALAMMVEGARSMVNDPDRCSDFASLLRSLAEPDGTPAIIHCSAGKDRTGWAASLLLLALGVDEEQVVDHYLESNHHRGEETARRIAAWEAAGIDWRPMEPFFGVQAEVAHAALLAVEDEWGGVDAYLRDGLRVDRSVVDALRAKLLEG